MKTPRLKPRSNGGVCVQRMVRRWTKFRKIPADDDGLWLAALKHGGVCLGRFYCGEFVQDGYRYNETPALMSWITHILKVEPPNESSSPTPRNERHP